MSNIYFMSASFWFCSGPAPLSPASRLGRREIDIAMFFSAQRVPVPFDCAFSLPLAGRSPLVGPWKHRHLHPSASHLFQKQRRLTVHDRTTMNFRKADIGVSSADPLLDFTERMSMFDICSLIHTLGETIPSGALRREFPTTKERIGQPPRTSESKEFPIWVCLRPRACRSLSLDIGSRSSVAQQRWTLGERRSRRDALVAVARTHCDDSSRQQAPSHSCTVGQPVCWE